MRVVREIAELRAALRAAPAGGVAFVPRYGFGFAATGDSVYAVGGNDGLGTFRTNEVRILRRAPGRKSGEI